MPSAEIRGQERGDQLERGSKNILFIGESAALYESLRDYYTTSQVTFITGRAFTQSDWPQQCSSYVKDVERILWEIPRLNTTTGTRQDRRKVQRSAQLCSEIIKADPQIPIIMLGPRSSVTWACADVTALTHQPRMRQVEFDWCALGATDDHGNPIRATTMVYANQELPPMRCRCAGGTVHTTAATMRPGKTKDGQRFADAWATILRQWATSIVDAFHSGVGIADDVTGADSISFGRKPTDAYPTDAKERQKQFDKSEKLRDPEAARVKPKRKTPLKCEGHMDDCGVDLSGLGKDQLMWQVYDTDSGADSLDEDYAFLEQGYLPGRDFSQVYAVVNTMPAVINLDRHTKMFGSMNDLLHYTNTQALRSSCCEIRNDRDGFTTVCVHWPTNERSYFDLVTRCDFSKSRDCEAYYEYLRKEKPFCVTMAPNERLSEVENDFSTKRTHDYAVFCSNIAKIQRENSKDWIMWQSPFINVARLEQWQATLNQDSTVQTKRFPRHAMDGDYPRIVYASHLDLLYYFTRDPVSTVCDSETTDWVGFPTLASWGIARKLQNDRWGSLEMQRYYPGAVGADDSELPAAAAPAAASSSTGPAWKKCPGCRRHRAADDTEHSRIPGECKHPTVVGRDWPCPGCKTHKPVDDPSHANDETCRNPHRIEGDPRVQPRATGAPRAAAKREPQPAGVRRTRAKRSDPLVRAGDADVAPSVPEPAEVIPVPHADDDDDGERTPSEGGAEGEDGQPRLAEPHGRVQDRLKYGKDTRSRDQRAKLLPYGDEDQTWGPSDLKQIVRLLNDRDPNVLRKQLRRLHLRWFHASIEQLTNLLQLLGVSQEAINLIPEIVDTCRICRMWAPKAPAVKVTTRLSIRFNQCVQADLMFYADEYSTPVSQHILLHMIDECIKWSEVHETPTKQPHDLLAIMTDQWFRRFGAPDMLIWDGEGALDSDEAKKWADLWQIELVIRPADKKAWISERHHEIMRQQLHKVTAQMKSENIVVPFVQIISMCVLAKNSMLNTGHGSPYQSLYGRTPRLLPQLVDLVGSARLVDETGPDGIRHVHRLREISVGAAVQALAEARAQLAEKSKTPLAGEVLGLKTGENVEIFRQPPTKDRPGWVGPAKVTDVSEIEHGKVTVRWQGRHMSISLECLRRAMTLFFICYNLSRGPEASLTYTTFSEALQTLMDIAETVNGRFVVIGKVQTVKGWHNTAETERYLLGLYALMHTAWANWRTHGCLGGTIAHAVRRIPSLSEGALCSKILYWNSADRDEYSTLEIDGAGEIQVDQVLGLERARWQRIRLVQWHFYKPEVVQACREEDHSVPELGGPEAPLGDSPERASTITLDDARSSNDVQEIEREAVMGDNFWADWLAEIERDIQDDPHREDVLDEWNALQWLSDPPDAEYSFLPVTPGQQYVYAVAERLPRRYCETPQQSTAQRDLDQRLCQLEKQCSDPRFNIVDLAPSEEFAELQMPCWMAYLSGYEVPGHILYDEDYVAVFQTDRAGVKRLIIETNKVQSNAAVSDDELRELTRKTPEVITAAILAELMRWVDNAAIKRQRRHLARNLVTSRYVFTWKLQADNSRILKCRLTVHGFKDNEKSSLERYSATATRWGQRMVVSTAVQCAWPLASLDITQAFLKGLTFDEIQKETGGKRREISLVLPKGRAGIEPSGNVILRNIKGFETFADAIEVLEMLKGGFGLIDAPMLFTKRVEAVFRESEIYPTTSETKLYVHHANEALDLMTSAHMDDFEATGPSDKLEWLLSVLRKHFGNDIKIKWDKVFVHTGIRHTMSSDNKRCELDQHLYAIALKPVPEVSYRNLKEDENLPEELEAAYLCLLGGAAWMMLTRLECAVYVSALQRASKTPKTKHLKRLNRVVRFMQKTRVPLVYLPLALPVVLLTIADSAYRGPDAEEATSERTVLDPTVMRGYIIALAHVSKTSAGLKQYTIQLLDYIAGKQSHVSRGVWSAELFNQCDALAKATVLLGFLEEVRCGPQPARVLMEKQESGTYGTKLEMYTDSMSIWSYLDTRHLKVPTEKNTLYHLAYCLEALTTGLVDKWSWCDTRDMVVDALTKGRLDRQPLQKLMAGYWILEHDTKTIQGRKKT